jgi:NAD(P)-dependent dehydrogenase (short-subunit alcohol dehydrogenase family)
MSGRLAGKIALITGAGSVGPGWGNGRATAVIFARQGARVFLADRNLAALEETAGQVRAEGGQAITHECDVTDGDQVATMVRRCAGELGRLDVLVNNVGGSFPGGPVELDEKTGRRSSRSISPACSSAASTPSR